MGTQISIINRINVLGEIGIDNEGRRTRLAASDQEKKGRDLIAQWMKEADLKVAISPTVFFFGIGFVQQFQ